jgi:hypothetical protein
VLLIGGMFVLATPACGRPETFRTSAIAGGAAGTAGAPTSTGDDAATGAAGSGDEDAAVDGAGDASASGGLDAERDAARTAGADGHDAARDVSAEAGPSDGGRESGADVSADAGPSDGGRDSGADLPAEQAPACASTTDCPCFSYGGHAYRFCTAPRSRSAAQANCVALGMRLVRIDSDAENQWIHSTKVAQNFMTTWIGANDIVTEGDWRWPDDVPFWTGKGGVAGSGPVGNLFNAWETSKYEPNQNGDEDCAAYWYTDAGWADLTCTDAYSYVCELY